jgi:nitric oxide synthase-interacting protein
MPRRKGKNTANAAFFSRHEISSTGYGSQRLRLGAESMIQFGTCAMCLRGIDRGDTMVATPSGRLYHRPCIILYMGNQTEALKRQQEAWEAQKHRLEAKEADESPTRTAASSSAAPSAKAGIGAAVDALSRDRKVRIVAGATGMLSEAARSSSYWRPDAVAIHAEELLQQPPKRPPSPQSGQPLRLKRLISLHPHRIQPDGTSGPEISTAGLAAAAAEAAAAPASVASSAAAHPDNGLIACALTGKPIKHSKAVAITT